MTNSCFRLDLSGARSCRMKQRRRAPHSFGHGHGVRFRHTVKCERCVINLSSQYVTVCALVPNSCAAVSDLQDSKAA